MKNQNKTTYANTAENAKKVGWTDLEEYCTGDPKAPFCTHDHARGLFHFHA